MSDKRKYHVSAILSVLTRVHMANPKNNPWGGFSHYKNTMDMFLDVIEFLTGHQIRVEEDASTYSEDRLGWYYPSAVESLHEQCLWLEDLYIPREALVGKGVVKDSVRRDWINKIIAEHGEWHTLYADPVRPMPVQEIRRDENSFPGYPGPCLN